jgi:hypothetical protein
MIGISAVYRIYQQGEIKVAGIHQQNLIGPTDAIDTCYIQCRGRCHFETGTSVSM